MSRLPEITFAPLSTALEPTTVLLVGEGGALAPKGRQLDKDAGGALGRAMAAADFKGKARASVEALGPGPGVPQRLILGAITSLAGFALLGWLAERPWFYTSLGIPERSDSAALLLILLVSPAFTWLVAPLLAAWSRQHEYQADEFAASHSDAQALADALVRLYRDNASTLTPDPVYSAFYDSHPPPTARIARLESLARRSPATVAAP